MELEQIKRQNRSSKFINDIGIYAIGNLGSKIITFLMVPLYTYFIDKPADYGYYDICLTVVFLLVPFITLQMREGSFRFLLDSRDESNRTKIISFVYRALASTIIISLAIVAIMSLTTGIRYLWYTFALLIFMSLNDVVAQIVRGLGGNKDFVAACIISSLGISIFSVVFVALLKMGVEGIFLANILARLISIVYLEIKAKVMKRYFNFNVDYKKIGHELLHYSLPLLPGTICWWLMSSSDRWFIQHYLGLEINGTYAVAIRFAGIIQGLSNIFYQAWQETAILQYNSKDRDRFFTKMLNTYIYVLAILLIIYIFTLKMCYSWLVDVKYQDSLAYIYPMCISAAIFAVSAFFDMGYQCAKDTKRTLPAIFISAIINLALNFLLTPLIGVAGIIITANITYLVLVVYRWYDMKRYLKLQIFKKTFIPILTSLVGLAMFYVMNAWWQDIVFMIAAIMVVIYTAPQFIHDEFITNIKNKLLRNNNKIGD